MADAKLISSINDALRQVAGAGLDLRSKKFVDVKGQPYFANRRSIRIGDGNGWIHGSASLPSENQSAVHISSFPNSPTYLDSPLTASHLVPASVDTGQSRTLHSWTVRTGEKHEHPEVSDEEFESLGLHNSDYVSVRKDSDEVEHLLLTNRPRINPTGSSIHDVINNWHRLPRLGYFSKSEDSVERLMNNEQLSRHNAAMRGIYPAGFGQGVFEDPELGVHAGSHAESPVGRGNIHVEHYHPGGLQHLEYDPQSESLRKLKSWKVDDKGHFVPE